MKSAVVITTSVNGVVSKKGSVAYDSSKSAANHIVRELAVELAPYARVNAVAPATVVKGSLMFPRDRVMASLAKYAIAYSEEESTEDLRLKLAEFYASRTLTNAPITLKIRRKRFSSCPVISLPRRLAWSSMSMAACMKPSYARSFSGYH